ncbi:Transcriptional regulator, MarR family [Alloactinosynnema sp. L-07]|uniref:MarR family winged helix-turn-helix transcriptional regulator n=1 Tax=Alloactinosynnema sp. L-07 TaxID=1653480 RepID=UPI00065F0828|nr:MarR family winged helix-turn-helix transcriptional regulator [Alloactinosynnema sp. L-07]CRK56038.1 Transcriptional regulator, MarR family [Alloactinosynnema sp. L-07]
MGEQDLPLVPGSVAEHTSCLLVKLGQVAFRLAERNLASHELRVRHYSILQALADNGPMTQLALGAYLRIDPATMVTSLDDLQTHERVERVRDPKDRRRYVVELTKLGRNLLGPANNALNALDGVVFEDLTDTEAKTLHRLLSKLSNGHTLPHEFDVARDQSSKKMSSAS